MTQNPSKRSFNLENLLMVGILGLGLAVIAVPFVDFEVPSTAVVSHDTFVSTAMTRGSTVESVADQPCFDEPMHLSGLTALEHTHCSHKSHFEPSEACTCNHGGGGELRPNPSAQLH